MLTSKKIKKINIIISGFLVFFSFVAVLFLFNSNESLAQATLPGQSTPYNEGTYEPLAKLRGLGNFNFNDPCPLGRYLNITINLIIGLIAVMAMVTIVMGGLQYITSELVSGKADGKAKILNAIFGLLIALSSYLILNTLNPNLLNLCLDGIPKIQINTDGIQGDEGARNFQAISKDKLKALGVDCPGSGGTSALPSIARSFAGKVNYSTASRGTINGSTINLDCSSFVSQVYACAGLPSPGNTTAGMFNDSNKTGSTQFSPNFTRSLTVGSLLGWEKGESSKYTTAGHVVMYLGNNRFIEVNSKSGVTERSLTSYQGNYYHLIK